MKVFVPLFAFFALASAQMQNLSVNLISPTQDQKFVVGDIVNVTIASNVCFVLLFVSYSLNDSN